MGKTWVHVSGFRDLVTTDGEPVRAGYRFTKNRTCTSTLDVNLRLRAFHKAYR